MVSLCGGISPNATAGDVGRNEASMINRRNFLKMAGVALAGLAVPKKLAEIDLPDDEPIAYHVTHYVKRVNLDGTTKDITAYLERVDTAYSNQSLLMHDGLWMTIP